MHTHSREAGVQYYGTRCPLHKKLVRRCKKTAAHTKSLTFSNRSSISAVLLSFHDRNLPTSSCSVAVDAASFSSDRIAFVSCLEWPGMRSNRVQEIKPTRLMAVLRTAHVEPTCCTWRYCHSKPSIDEQEAAFLCPTGKSTSEMHPSLGQQAGDKRSSTSALTSVFSAML